MLFKIEMPSTIECEFLLKELPVLNIPLENNYFMKIILRDQNLLWKNELFSLLEAQNVNLSYDEYNLMIKSNGSIFSKTQLEWSIGINTIINNFFNEFHFEEITFNQSNIADISEMTKQINVYRRIFFIDYYQNDVMNKIWILGRKPHIEYFFILYKNFKHLSKIATHLSVVSNINNNNNVNNNINFASKSVKKKRKVVTLKESLYENTNNKKSKND